MAEYEQKVKDKGDRRRRRESREGEKCCICIPHTPTHLVQGLMQEHMARI